MIVNHKIPELDGMAAVANGVANQTFPHTMDATVWANEFNKTLFKTRGQAVPVDLLIGWFANAIMAGYDTAMMAKTEQKDQKCT